MQSTPAPARSRAPSLLTGESIQRLLALGALVILLVFFSIVVPHFASTNNYIDILTATAVNGVLATGVTFVIITGGIDLSLGTAMTFCSVVMGLVSVNMGLPLPLGLLAAFAAGALVGLTNGFLIAKLKLPPFIATLGMLYVTLGMAQVLSDVHPPSPGSCSTRRSSAAIPLPSGPTRRRHGSPASTPIAGRSSSTSSMACSWASPASSLPRA
jgi:ribose transport system permease protein